ncbi:hypothetical protein SAMN02745126_03117 [Enhydrobacter aerosaccus]|uniref:Uncharacterized protein n=1 Tax=Enhydrobacter aerosaccus TaxID=225324 RepID=A0A1T4QBM4_9HYPH|nr:hypothetical protein [Enhydrobacter aerosaccus]SKA01016.1 hypothetical protein SAMN02745126_03117 [Enhydrobacter aerosaccus]
MPDTFYYLLSWFLGIGSFVMLMVLIGHLLVSLVLIIPTWRICERAGFAGAWSLLHLVPVIGSFVVMAILAFGDWPNGEATAEAR